jgi:hypothetical protein
MKPRGWNHRDIETVHHPEGPGRLILSLERLLAGLCCIGFDREKAIDVAEKVALASVPPARRHAFELLETKPKPTREIAKAMNLPTVTTRRHLEDITSQGLACEAGSKRATTAVRCSSPQAATRKRKRAAPICGPSRRSGRIGP